METLDQIWYKKTFPQLIAYRVKRSSHKAKGAGYNYDLTSIRCRSTMIRRWATVEYKQTSCKLQRPPHKTYKAQAKCAELEFICTELWIIYYCVVWSEMLRYLALKSANEQKMKMQCWCCFDLMLIWCFIVSVFISVYFCILASIL